MKEYAGDQSVIIEVFLVVMVEKSSISLTIKKRKKYDRLATMTGDYGHHFGSQGNENWAF